MTRHFDQQQPSRLSGIFQAAAKPQHIGCRMQTGGEAKPAAQVKNKGA